MKLYPVNGHVVIKRLVADEKSAGGILIPESAQEKPARGVVLGVGDGSQIIGDVSRRILVNEGDEVLFGKWVGQEIDIDGEKVVIIKATDILARVER